MFGKNKKKKQVDNGVNNDLLNTDIDLGIDDVQINEAVVEDIAEESIKVEESVVAQDVNTVNDNNIDMTDITVDVFDNDLDFGSFSEVSTITVGDNIFGSLMQSDSGEEILVLDEDVSFDSITDKDGFYTIETGDVDEQGKKVTKKVKVKKRKKCKDERDFSIGIMLEEHYGDLLPYIKDINVTDINWN